MRVTSLLLIAAIVGAYPAHAESISAGAHGFEVRHSVNLVVPPNEAWAAFLKIGRWWSDEHTYSGKAANLALDERVGGCFCERFPEGGGIEHLRVAYVKPGEQMILTGGLGPLLYEATAGVMDVKVERIAGGSRLTATYRAAGFARANGTEMAPLVDRVLGEQIKTLRTFAASGGGK